MKKKSEININSLSVGWHFYTEFFLRFGSIAKFSIKLAFLKDIVLVYDSVIFWTFLICAKYEREKNTTSSILSASEESSNKQD